MAVMERFSRFFLFLFLLLPLEVRAQEGYQPTPENLKAREAFSDARFGIFLHWGLYSLFGQGEWYMQNAGIPHEEYAKSARAFYPAHFDARQWARAIKASGAGYVCFTTRHHDGFSLWHTRQSDYNVVEATPWGRDVLKELAEACREEGLRLHLYYSHIDWGRPDYPMGRTGRKVGKDPAKADWPQYYRFMNAQLTELLTQYGPVDAIWFDGWWDHDEDSVPFDWQLPEQYALIHRLQPACLVGNNHHQTPHPGEDIQIFERDLPGENKAGLSGQAVSRLPLETCETMNGMWGYKVTDQAYKSVDTLVHYLVKAAGKGANLLLNVGPQPSGELPAAALERMQGIGRWMDRYGETIRGTVAGDVPVQPWGATTRKGNRLFVHVLKHDSKTLILPLGRKVRKALTFDGRRPIACRQTSEGLCLSLPEMPHGADYILELETQ